MRKQAFHSDYTFTVCPVSLQGQSKEELQAQKQKAFDEIKLGPGA